MNHDKYRVRFEELIKEVKQPLCGRDDLSIWGGTCAEDTLIEFLNGWPLERMPYRIWESTDRIDFEKNTPAPNVALLERGRLFGPGGDLDVRRDGDGFRWRFVGPAGMHSPDNAGEDFWENYSGVEFHEHSEIALLWGKGRDTEHESGWYWFEDRVASADLDYQVEGQPERVQIEYRAYSRSGQVEFVWLTGLSAWKEQDNG